MARKWTEDEDLFIIAYFDALGAFIGPHDLGRSRRSTIQRAQWLKKSGAWGAYLEAQRATERARDLARGV